MHKLPDYWHYSPKVSHQIAKHILDGGDAAYLKQVPRYDDTVGRWKLDWVIPQQNAAADCPDPPGGNESNECPPNC